MSHWHFGGAKQGSTIVVVICGETQGDEAEMVSAVYAIPVKADCDSEAAQIAADTTQEDHVYIDVEQCPRA